MIFVGCGIKTVALLQPMHFVSLKDIDLLLDWEIDPDIGVQTPTKIITTGLVCPLSFCDGFKFILCQN